MDALATLSGFDRVCLRPATHFPLRLLGIGALADGLLRILPGLRRLALVEVAVLRPLIPESGPPSVSIIIPARNERGNIRATLERLPELPGVQMEVIFAESHSTDGTWDEIRRVADGYSGNLKVAAFQQQGVGKGDAVRLGFAQAWAISWWCSTRT